MKKSLTYTALLAGTAFTLVSCQKANSISEQIEDRKKNKDLCVITSFSYSNSAVPSQTIFTNHYDVSGRTIEVEAGVYSGGVIMELRRINVEWTNQGIYFIDADALQDTILVANLDKKGKVKEIIPGNKASQDFLPTFFDYDHDRVSSMKISLAGNFETSYFDYDERGNLVSIADAPTTSVPIPGKVEHHYSNQKAEDQFYFDEPRKFSWNSFSLLQYIGLFPELKPVNLRTSTKVMWGMNYQAYSMDIINQRLDGNGKLISYDIVSPGSTNVISHFNINWSCNQSDLVQKQQGLN